MLTTSKFYVYDASVYGNTYLSNHFQLKEFRCHDGSKPVFVSAELIQVLEDVRMHFDAATTINSGYRTQHYNSTIDSASSNSKHMYGLAADIVVKGHTPLEVYNYLSAKYSNSLGLGLYDTFVHVDVRTKKSRWDYRTKK